MNRLNRMRADVVLAADVKEDRHPSPPPSAPIGQQEPGTGLGLEVCDASLREDVYKSQDTIQPDDNAAKSARPEDGLAVPMYRLYSLNQILSVQTVAVLLLGNPLVGIWMVFRNFKRLRQPHRARIMLAAGILSWLSIVVLALEIPSCKYIAPMAFNIVAAVSVFKIARATQGKAISDHERQGGKIASRWSVFLVFIVSLASAVFFEAQAVGRSFINGGLLAGKWSVTVTRHENTPVVAFQMAESMFTDSNVQLKFHGYAEQLSECCFAGQPIEVWLVDNELKPRIKLTWDTRPRVPVHRTVP